MKIVNPDNPSEFIETDRRMPGEEFILDSRRSPLENPCADLINGLEVSPQREIKLWHDDVRRPPKDSWMWVRNNAEAQLLLKFGKIGGISLDHDLGGAEIPEEDLGNADFMQLHSEETGLDLVTWMCEHDCVPDFVRIHSMNTPAAKRMMQEIESFWYHDKLSNTPTVEIRPFDPIERL